MTTTSARRLRLVLSQLVEPGDPRLVALLRSHSAGEIVDAGIHGRPLGGSVLPEVWRLRAPGVLDRTAALAGRAGQLGLRWVCPGDDAWPERLVDLDATAPISGTTGAPLGLWTRGTARLDELVARSVAIVGARAATTYGSDVAMDIAGDVADAGHTVVSGAAFGIDACAHRGALALGAPTLAVLACGADVDYPRAHAGLLQRIAAGGLVVSEQMPGQTPTKGRFLSRNRIIAAITGGTVVVEAARRSGALNTLNWASELGRVAMGVPGPVTSQASVGVHQSLRSGQSMVVTSGAEVIEAVGEIGATDATLEWSPSTALDELQRGSRIVLEAVSARDAEPTEVIASRISCATDDALTVLADLCAAGWVEQVGSGWRLRRRADLSPGQQGHTVAR